CESLDSTGGWLSASRFKRCAYSMNSGLELSGASCRRLAPTNYEVPGSAISFLPVFMKYAS
ncbi:hypothetical protein, partial [Pseudomonas aeruginosa]|uniref:hypothetical protein n=1 Tax=Pseudomonas aeruginosa TaxID=287 RepID=UPI00402B400B